MKIWLGPIAAVLIATSAQAQSDPYSGAVFLPSCLAAADIVQGKRPAADSEDMAKQMRQAAICFGGLAAIKNVEAFFTPEFAACPPPDNSSMTQRVLIVTAYLKSHREALGENFHKLAVAAYAAAWPCAK
jgi:Rap1a immunity proteins